MIKIRPVPVLRRKINYKLQRKTFFGWVDITVSESSPYKAFADTWYFDSIGDAYNWALAQYGHEMDYIPWEGA